LLSRKVQKAGDACRDCLFTPQLDGKSILTFYGDRNIITVQM